MSNEVVLKGRMVSLWSGEDGMFIDWGMNESMMGYMLNGELSNEGGNDCEEMVERGIGEVVEYDMRFGEEGISDGEEVKKFRRIMEKVKESEFCCIEKVIIWSVEYDMNVSVLLVNEEFVKDWEGLREVV